MEINNDKQINNTDVIGLGVKSMNKEDDLFDIKKSLENMGKLTGIINARNVGNKETSIYNLDKLTKEIKSNYVKSQNIKEKPKQNYKI